jgi:hypothetical protein
MEELSKAMKSYSPDVNSNWKYTIYKIGLSTTWTRCSSFIYQPVACKQYATHKKFFSQWRYYSKFWRSVNSYVDINISEKITVFFFLGWRWTQHVSPKRWYLPTSADGVKTQMNIIFTPWELQISKYFIEWLKCTDKIIHISCPQKWSEIWNIIDISTLYNVPC